MEKVSRYNNFVVYKDNILCYNTLSNALALFTKDEFEVIECLLQNLNEFKEEYPELYAAMYKRGFVVSEDFDELAYVKLQNNKVIYSSNQYHVIINPTLDCNLTCWYCSTEYSKAVHSGRMSDEMVCRVKKHLKKLIDEENVKSLHLDWFGGEPMLYFDEVINPISSYVKENLHNNMNYTQHITTNATLFTEDRIYLMKELGFTSFQIPIDGNEVRHNKIKYNKDKSGTYKQVLETVNRISDIMPDSTIILRINYDTQTLKNIKDIAKDLSEKCKQTLLIDFQKVWQVPNRKEEIDLLREVKIWFENEGFSTTFWAFVPKQFHRCYADRLNNYAINYDGRIFKCTARDYGNDKVIGTLLENGDVDWNQSLLAAMFDKSTFENERCLNCNKMPVCMGPCITSNYEARLRNEPIPCNLDHAQYSFDSYVIEEAKKRSLI